MISWPHRHFWRCGTTRSTIISGHIGHSRNTNKSPPTRRSQRASGVTSLALPLRINMSARQAANGEGYAPLPDPLCARLLPRLACALNRPLFVHFLQPAPPASSGTALKKLGFNNCAKLCTFLHFFRHRILIKLLD